MRADDDRTHREIMAIEDEMQRALIAADTTWFEENWTPDALWVHLGGAVDTVAAFTDLLRTGSVVYRSREIGDLRIRTFGDTAIVTGWSKLDILVNGRPGIPDTRFTRVYVRIGDRWFLATNQSGSNRTPS